MSIDFTLMYVTHDAFRRDLSRLRQAAADGRTDSVGVQLGWENFKRQLHVHHTSEDEALWPRVEAASAGRADAAEILAAMAAEHARLDPLLEAVDAALTQRSTNPVDLPGAVADLETALGGHMKHEEDAALPLIQEVLAPQGLGRVRPGHRAQAEAVRRCGIRALGRRRRVRGSAGGVLHRHAGARQGSESTVLESAPRQAPPLGLTGRVGRR